MDRVELTELTSGYRERIRRLALFDPLFELDRKRETDRNGKPIDMKGLGLLTLLFFFEQKLIRQYRTGVKQLTSFLEDLVSDQYALDEESLEKIARTIIQTFRPTTGKKRGYEFFNWEEQKDGVIEYSILKANSFDVKTNTQFYALDEDGLELVFATKEFYSEFQLSINQLMLRKQLDKGEFKGALRQINEMAIDVETLEERIVKLKHEIQRSIVSEETFERYKQLLDDIYGRLAREDEEFKELRLFVKETRERLYSRDVHKKERKTYQLILQINQELESVHYDHSRLLDRSLELKNTTLLTAQESLYYTGIQAFNFDQDVVSKIVSTPLPLEAMEGVLQPFLKVEQNERWSPLSIFAEQNITEREERVEQRFEDVDESDNESPRQKWLSRKYVELMTTFLEAYEQEDVRTLRTFMDYLDEQNRSSWYEQRYFYDFWLVLHQRSPNQAGDLNEEDGQTLLGDALSLLRDRTLLVQEGQGVIQQVNRYSIQDMVITIEGGEEDELFGA